MPGRKIHIRYYFEKSRLKLPIYSYQILNWMSSHLEIQTGLYVYENDGEGIRRLAWLPTSHSVPRTFWYIE